MEIVYTGARRRHDEARVHAVLTPSPDRVQARCAHFGVCGGCALQHLAPAAQLQAKQRVLFDNLERLGGVVAARRLAPVTGPVWGYRHKARLGVKHVDKKGRVLVGFRERSKPYVADLHNCPVLHPDFGERLDAFAALVSSLSIVRQLPQIEVARGDEFATLILRVLEAPDADDLARLEAFAREHDFDLYLQPAGPDSVRPLGEARPMRYALDDGALQIEFEPGDFTQVNPQTNRAMVAQALELLRPTAGDDILDLFCGLGNFTLPVARRAGSVTGVEGDAALVARARSNASANAISNAQFHTADLFEDVSREPWFGPGYSGLIIDPPRSGAQWICEHMDRLAPQRIVYVSCYPATLARDAGILAGHGYRLDAAGVVDMFPHTAHVEAMALFRRDGH